MTTAHTLQKTTRLYWEYS